MLYIPLNLYVNKYGFCAVLFAEQMADFKDSVHKSISIRRKSSGTSILSHRGRLVRQQAVYENIGDVSPTRRFSNRRLSENISRFTIEDIPFAAVPSAFPGRSAFAGQEDILREVDDAEEEQEEEVNTCTCIL